MSCAFDEVKGSKDRNWFADNCAVNVTTCFAFRHVSQYFRAWGNMYFHEYVNNCRKGGCWKRIIFQRTCWAYSWTHGEKICEMGPLANWWYKARNIYRTPCYQVGVPIVIIVINDETYFLAEHMSWMRWQRINSVNQVWFFVKRSNHFDQQARFKSFVKILPPFWST